LPNLFSEWPAATASSRRCCRAEAFLITSVYTRFFSAADTLRMNSENAVEVTGLIPDRRENMAGEAERLRDALKRITREAERPAKDGRAGSRTKDGYLK